MRLEYRNFHGPGTKRMLNEMMPYKGGSGEIYHRNRLLSLDDSLHGMAGVVLRLRMGTR